MTSIQRLILVGALVAVVLAFLVPPWQLADTRYTVSKALPPDIVIRYGCLFSGPNYVEENTHSYEVRLATSILVVEWAAILIVAILLCLIVSPRRATSLP